MRIRIPMLSLLLVTALVVGGSVAAGAHQGDPDDRKDDRKATHLTLYAAETAATFVTAAGVVNPPEEAPPAPGDRFLAVDTIYADEDRTEAIGRNDVECSVVEATGTTEADLAVHFVCHGVLQLDGQGSLTWQGPLSFSGAEEVTAEPVITVAITGGTGDFLAAGGEVEVFDTTADPETPTSRYEVTLLEFKRQRHGS